MDTRTVVLKVMPGVVKILKERFPNLGAEESVLLASRIAEVVREAHKESDDTPIPSAG